MIASYGRHAISVLTICCSSAGQLLQDLQAQSIEPSSVRTVTIGMIVEAWRERQSKIQAAEFTWEPPNSDDGRWIGYQRMCKAENKFAPKHPRNLLQLLDNSSLYVTARWYYSTYLEYCPNAVANNRLNRVGRSDAYYWFHFHECVFHDLRDFETAIHKNLPGGKEQNHNPRPYRSVTRDGVRTELFSQGDGQYSEAKINNWTEYADTEEGIIDDLYMKPILLACRPLCLGLGSINIEQCGIKSHHSFINDLACIQISETKLTGVTVLYWISPERDFNILRYIAKLGDRTIAQADTTYGRNEVIGWIPVQWVVQVFPVEREFPGQELIPIDAKGIVTTSQINPVLDEYEFCFPTLGSGTFVNDGIRREHYIVSSDGGRIVLDQRDGGTSYADLLSRNRDSVSKASECSPFRRPLLFAATVSLSLAAVLRVRNRRLSSRPFKK